MQYSDRHPGGDSSNAEFGLGVFLHRQRFDDSHIFFCVCLNLILARRSRFGDAAFALHAVPWWSCSLAWPPLHQWSNIIHSRSNSTRTYLKNGIWICG